ncbi:hypothetical protein CTEN210_02738 [Chaetoceros tenuissimus]|uniref:Beta-1,4-glucuronyltransferase 1 n=1 Tax=Chaetoceros tenuissimus TaxID=426638 RepID=A0AAD3H1C6_9STRA|nr:hypothetical protein CTEN210_02738 [Chaetoceros tenuissimus]
MTTITRPLLITGVGRTGTTSVCTLFRKIGIKVSHDNDVDCGPYPGEDGAVSWYDAFKSRSGKRYKHVIHMVRDPLKTIYSRITKCKAYKKEHLDFLKYKVREYEKIDKNETCSSFSLKHWVMRNSFVSNYASWMVRTEDFFTEALTVWEVCMAASFDQKRHCPDLFAIEPFLKSAPTSLNSLYAGSERSRLQEISNQTIVADSAGLLSWESLARDVGGENLKYIKIAQKMAYRPTDAMLQRLTNMAKRWSGPISVSVFNSDKTKTDQVKLAIDNFQARNMETFGSRISFHLVTDLVSARGKDGNVFPRNLLRNIAIENAAVEFILLLDANLKTSSEAHEKPQQHLKEVKDDNIKYALVVPAFERPDWSAWPEWKHFNDYKVSTKEDLLKLMHMDPEAIEPFL